MAQVVRGCGNGWVLGVALVFLAAILPGASGQARHSLGSKAPSKLARAVDKIVREGLHAKLPPHISTLLGVSSDEKECLVVQNVVRTGKLVQGFDVSTANQNDVVLFIVDEATNDQTLYLTSPQGSLRKVVSVEAGVGTVQRITSKEKKAFEKEKEFWL